MWVVCLYCKKIIKINQTIPIHDDSSYLRCLIVQSNCLSVNFNWGGAPESSPEPMLPPLESILLSFIEEIRFGATQVDNLGAAIPVFL